jgi:hypothetical protein
MPNFRRKLCLCVRQGTISVKLLLLLALYVHIMFNHLSRNNWCLRQLSHATAQSCCFPKKSTATWLPCATNLFRGNELFVPKAISEAGCLETEVMRWGNCLWNSVWKSGYTRNCGWLEWERQNSSYHVPLSIQLAVSLPRGNKSCDISEVLVYWLHRDLMVGSCSIIIYNVYVPLCTIWWFTQCSSVQKEKGRCEGEGTGIMHAVTEVELTILDISWSIYIQYKSVKTTSICFDAIIVPLGIFLFYVLCKNMQQSLSVWKKSGIPLDILLWFWIIFNYSKFYSGIQSSVTIGKNKLKFKGRPVFLSVRSFKRTR